MNSRRVVLATGNPGKVRELAERLSGAGMEVLAQTDLDVPAAEEPAVTFVENALLKARHAARHADLPAIADDSGLAVPALGGAPGVRSARYAGPDAGDADNVERLLTEMRDLRGTARRARFHCLMVFLRSADDPTPVICEGRWPGTIADAPRGGGGFGYDPVFVPDGFECTAAELSLDEKNRISHRGQALDCLVHALGPGDST